MPGGRPYKTKPKTENKKHKQKREVETPLRKCTWTKRKNSLHKISSIRSEPRYCPFHRDFPE